MRLHHPKKKVIQREARKRTMTREGKLNSNGQLLEDTSRLGELAIIHQASDAGQFPRTPGGSGD